MEQMDLDDDDRLHAAAMRESADLIRQHQGLAGPDADPDQDRTITLENKVSKHLVVQSYHSLIVPKQPTHRKPKLRRNKAMSQGKLTTRQRELRHHLAEG